MARVLTIAAVALALLLVAIALLPWWLGAALRPLGKSHGLEFKSYERVGYGRFALREVTYVRDGLNFTAARVETNHPLRFIRTGGDNRAELQNWELVITPRASPAEPAAESGVPALHGQLQNVLRALRQRLPSATASDGMIRFGERQVSIESAEWSGGTLRATGVLFEEHPFAAGLATPGDAFVLAVQLPSLGAAADLRWEGATLAGTGTWWEQPLEFQATFPDTGWLPREAHVRAPDWDLPAERVQLGEQFERVRGGAELTWHEDGFQLNARADANPRPGADVPPLRATAAAHGDREWFTIDALDVRAPFADIVLTAPLEMAYDGQMRSPPARLTVAGDLAKQPWVTATGRVDGQIELAGAGPESRGEFALTVTELAAAGFAADRAQLRGHWLWPRIELAEVSAQLNADSSVRGSGALDWQRRELSDVKFGGRIDRDWLARPLPAGLTWREAEFTLTAAGPLEAPRHAGTLEVAGLSLDVVRTLDVTAKWKGQERALDSLTIAATGDGTRVDFEGALDEHRLHLRALTLAAGDTEPLRLTAPTLLSWRPHLQVAPTELLGGRSRLAIEATLGPAMHYTVAATDLDAAWWRRWIDFGGPDWAMSSLSSQGKTERGVLNYRIDLAGTVRVEDTIAQINAIASGNAGGLTVEKLDISEADRAMSLAAGRLPVVVATAPLLQVRLDERAPLEFEAAIAPDSPLWPLLGEFAGIAVEGAALQANLSGSVREPRGELSFTAKRIHASGGKFAGKLPELTELSLGAHGERGEIAVDALSVRVEGHPLTASGRLPMTSVLWNQLRAAPREFEWDRADARVEFVDADVMLLTRNLTQSPLTQGRLTARAHLAGGQLRGSLRLVGGATRPLPGLGVVQEIEATLALHDRSATVESFSARIGGEPIRGTGTVALADDQTLQLDVNLAARNLPLVRRPGLLVRANFDLRAHTEPSGLTKLSGRVRLVDSLVMADLAAILPGGPRGTARRPPYFSVAAEPFARWPLDISVRGPQAVRVRTAVFDGVATPQFHLSGTLGDPRAIGSLNVDAGKVLFPFATFTVQSGTVRLSEADPYVPRLNVISSVRRHGYDLRMEAGGTLERPTLTFSSNPPLEAADVLLMVTTGQPPTDEAGSMTGQQRLTRLGTYLGRGIFKNFGAAGGEDKLEISSGEDVSREGRETYQAEYRINERLSLIGEYDQYDAYNAGIKWRIYTQEGPTRERRRR